MQVINGKGIAWDNEIDFYTKVIDIDFYNSTNRRLHLGHVNDCNFTLLRLIMPKEYNDYSVVMYFKSNNSEALTFIPKIKNGEHYFSITGNCTKKASQGYIQFVVQCIENENIIVQAISDKIPYIIEETLESMEPSDFTPEEASEIELLRSSIQKIEQDIDGFDSDIGSIDLQLNTIESTLVNKADKTTTDLIEQSLGNKANKAEIITYIINNSDWNDLTYTIYKTNLPTWVNKNTKIDILPSELLYNQLLADNCGGLYVTTEENNDVLTFTLHAIDNALTVDIALQLALQQVKIN